MYGLQDLILSSEVRSGYNVLESRWVFSRVISVSHYTAERSLAKAAFNLNSQTQIFLFPFLDLCALKSVLKSNRTLKASKFQI